MQKRKILNATQKGITLIALIITIIILLILAGVTINVLIGENGLLNTAKEAGEKYEKAAIKEELESVILDIQISNYMNITMKDIIDELPIKCPGVEWIDTDQDEPIGEYKGYEFKVKSDYTVEILGIAQGDRPEITKVEIQRNGDPIESVNIKVTVKVGEGRTVTSVIEEKSNTNLEQNANGTYSLNGITENGIYIIKVTDSAGKTRTKNVEINEFKVKVTVNTDGNGTANGTGEYKAGEKISLQATANQDFKFKGWYIGNTEISKANPFTYEVEKEITITAKFEFDGILINKITFKKDTVSIGKDATTGIQLEYTIEPENATNKSVIWEVDNLDLLTVTEGKLVAKGTEGTAKVICKALYGDAKAECTVKIIDGTFIYTPEDFINNFAFDKRENENNIPTDRAKYYLMNDIDMSGHIYKTKTCYFAGTLDGQGHTISNLTIKSNKWSDNEVYGLTAYANYCTYKNLVFENVTVDGSGYGYSVGVLAGSAYYKAKVENVGITGTVSGKGAIGSFFGNSGLITKVGDISFKNCYARTALTASGGYDQGGFSGGNQGDIQFTNCYFSGTMNAKNRVGTFQASALGVFSKCYYNSTLFKLTVSNSGNPLTTEQFRSKDNFEGWDFENTWYIDEKTGYPELKF